MSLGQVSPTQCAWLCKWIVGSIEEWWKKVVKFVTQESKFTHTRNKLYADKINYSQNWFHKRDSEEDSKLLQLLNEWFLGWNPVYCSYWGWLGFVGNNLFSSSFSGLLGKKTIYSKSLNNGLSVKWRSRSLLTLTIVCIFRQLNFVSNI